VLLNSCDNRPKADGLGQTIAMLNNGLSISAIPAVDLYRPTSFGECRDITLKLRTSGNLPTEEICVVRSDGSDRGVKVCSEEPGFLQIRGA
jgi:hypothetical protein